MSVRQDVGIGRTSTVSNLPSKARVFSMLASGRILRMVSLRVGPSLLGGVVGGCCAHGGHGERAAAGDALLVGLLAEREDGVEAYPEPAVLGVEAAHQLGGGKLGVVVEGLGGLFGV